MKKLAVIRDEESEKCPFGLNILSGCKLVGDSISQMDPLDSAEDREIKEKVRRNNEVIYLTQKNDSQCPYANKILNDFNAVECNYGDTASGEKTSYLPASPLYPRNTIGDGVSPSLQTPVQVGTDPRLTFEGPSKGLDVQNGMFSIFSNRSNELALLKMADSTNKISNIRDKIAILRDKYFYTLNSIIPSRSIVKLNNEQLEELLLVIDDWTKQ